MISFLATFVVYISFPSSINLSKDSKPRAHLSLIIFWNRQLLICAQYYFTLSKCPFKISLSAVPDVQIKHLIYLAQSSGMTWSVLHYQAAREWKLNVKQQSLLKSMTGSNSNQAEDQRSLASAHSEKNENIPSLKSTREEGKGTTRTTEEGWQKYNLSSILGLPCSSKLFLFYAEGNTFLWI